MLRARPFNSSSYLMKQKTLIWSASLWVSVVGLKAQMHNEVAQSAAIATHLDCALVEFSLWGAPNALLERSGLGVHDVGAFQRSGVDLSGAAAADALPKPSQEPSNLLGPHTLSTRRQTRGRDIASEHAAPDRVRRSTSNPLKASPDNTSNRGGIWSARPPRTEA